MGAHLLTFWPPGPEDRLNDTSHILRGILSRVKLDSQLRIREMSESFKGSDG